MQSHVLFGLLESGVDLFRISNDETSNLSAKLCRRCQGRE